MECVLVESKEVLVYNIQPPDMSQVHDMQGMQGMMPLQQSSKMKVVCKGDDAAIFDIKQGMFVEWEVKPAYKMPTIVDDGADHSHAGCSA